MKNFKRLALLLLLGVFTLTVNAQTSTDQNISETERIIDKYGGQLQDGFNTLVAKVTPMAEDGFEMVVKLKMAEGIIYLTVAPFCLLFWVMYFIFYSKAKAGDKYDWTEADYGHTTIVFLVLAACTTIGLIPALYHGVLLVAAPEWFAIKEILSLL